MSQIFKIYSKQRTAKKPKGTFKQDDAAEVSKSTYLVGAAVGAAKVVAAAGAAAGKFLGISATAGGAGEGVGGWVAEREEAGEVAAQAYAWRAWRQRWPLRLVACEEDEVL